jgi:N-acyl homoserine lactone hydrolase
MEVRALTTVRVRRKRAERGVRRYLASDWADSTLPVHAFLVEHSKGLCLFDTGQTARAAAPGYLPRWHPFLRLARFELGPQDEAAAQVDPASVRWVVLSHLHTDHVGGLEPFARAEVLVARTEWERARGLAGRVRGYLPQHWPVGLEPRLVEPAPEGPDPLGGSYDLAGDGRLLVVPLPGHTPGHLGLLVGDGRNPTHLLAGDAGELPPELARYCRKRGVAVLRSHDERA